MTGYPPGRECARARLRPGCRKVRCRWRAVRSGQGRQGCRGRHNRGARGKRGMAEDASAAPRQPEQHGTEAGASRPGATHRQELTQELAQDLAHGFIQDRSQDHSQDPAQGRPHGDAKGSASSGTAARQGCLFLCAWTVLQLHDSRLLRCGNGQTAPATAPVSRTARKVGAIQLSFSAGAAPPPAAAISRNPRSPRDPAHRAARCS